MEKDENKALLDWRSQGTTVERLGKWLSDDNSYTKLLPKHLPRELPTRLLYLESSAAADPVVRLLDDCNSTLDAATPYFALSHSWGNVMPIELKSHLLASFTKGIDYFDLPKTFRDAVDLTLQLGVSYIWIDSLCIIQDSSTDWLHEAQRMALVYTFSHLTIAASASMNPLTGLASTGAHPQPIFVRPTWWNYHDDWKYDSGQLLRVHDDGVKSFEHAIVSSPLNKRGWTYQEYLLSPRVLHCKPICRLMARPCPLR